MYSMNCVKHIAIIMDGNRRYAKKHLIAPLAGHKSSIPAVRAAIEGAMESGAGYLTLYAFSTENWKRGEEECRVLFELLVQALGEHLEMLIQEGISLKTLGDLSAFPTRLQQRLQEVVQATHIDEPRLTLTLALNYGGRDELVRAAEVFAVSRGTKSYEQCLESAYLPDVDLMIRTGGEQRLSNFLLWKVAYAELYWTDVLWPAFTKAHLREALSWYAQRERRFGGTV